MMRQVLWRLEACLGELANSEKEGRACDCGMLQSLLSACSHLVGSVVGSEVWGTSGEASASRAEAVRRLRSLLGASGGT